MNQNYLNEFENPSSEFRGAPFWAWNCKLEKDTLLKQIDYFKKMGMGGFTIHCRTGLDTQYMGKEFLDIVKACTQRAKQLDMKACLYDEDRWPSGFGGGEVTKDESYRSRYLVFTSISNEERKKSATTLDTSTASANVRGDGRLLARYDITLKDGYLHTYRRLQEGEEGHNVWYAYLEISANSAWYNNQSYANTLDKKTIQRFIETTHEKYYEAVGEEFGKTIPSIFTDEPQFVHKTTFGKAEDRADVILPYTDDFEESYEEMYGDSFLDHLPEVCWEIESQDVSQVRYRYHDHIAERFATAYADTLGKWCDNHGIKLTGHMMEEPTLHSQTAALGEAMRHYRGFKIPGIDMLCDWREYTTAKQAQSASHQMGCNKVLSELYGVTNWDFDFRGHKLQGDWQAALGVTERVHHLSWVSMKGEAKRDYPASIFYQSPWYERYSEIETYFARINTALQSGEPGVKVGVIHPIESYWLYFGPQEQTTMIRNKLQMQFQQITEWLLFGLIDFDFISESLMEDCKEMETSTKGFSVGKMTYDMVVVPGCVTLRSTTMQRLSTFIEQGGKVIFLGETPSYVDAVRSQWPMELSRKASTVEFDQGKLLQQLQGVRELDMKDDWGVRSDHYISQIRCLGEDRIVFLANGKKPDNIDSTTGKSYTITIKGMYEVTELDPICGKVTRVGATYKGGHTILQKELYEEDSVLLYLKSSKEIECSSVTNSKQLDTKKRPNSNGIPLSIVSKYELSEPNVLLLDQAEYSLDGEPYRGIEEVLRIDNILREELKYPRKMDALAQPWTQEFSEPITHTLSLRYRIQSELEIDQLQLAMEDVESALIILNNEKIDHSPIGYYVDEAIQTINIPSIHKGENELLIQVPYSKKTNLEWCYLLGQFGVQVMGNRAKIVPMPKAIGFSDLAAQNFPFYAGNMTYTCEFTVEQGEYDVVISKYRAPLLSIKLDGKEAGTIMFAPYRVRLGELQGKHTLEITAYGSRINAFGPVHLCNEKEQWFGPSAWRTTGCNYSYEYQLKRIGIVAAPILKYEEKDDETIHTRKKGS